MISKALIKHITSLHHNKFRDLHGEFIAEGIKVVNELLRSRFHLRYLCALNQWLNDNKQLVEGLNAEVIEVNAQELSRISALNSPNNVLAIFEKSKNDQLSEFSANELILALEDIRDPGNMGTMIRIADWFGIEQMVCSKASADIYNPKTVQATMGSIARVNVYYHNLDEFIQLIPEDMQIFATALEGDNIYNASLPSGGIILIGNESHGLSEKLLNHAHRKLCIPPFSKQHTKTGGAESLNASVAAAIVCSEFRRRTNN